MNNKIVVVSMAKNEADIIESFVRYYMTFVDGMIILDHNSDDDTGFILAELQKEYPQLIVDKLETVEYVQSEMMTALVKIAANEMDADWILPFDIDEYLLPKDGADCRSLLNNATDNVISLNWIDHELADATCDRDTFLLNRPCNRSININPLPKVIIRGSFFRNNDVKVAQGNHGVVFNTTTGGEQWIPARKSQELMLAHFPFRSQEQYISKNAIGWLTNTLKFSTHTLRAVHWKKEFDAICNNHDEMPIIPESQFVGKLYKESIALKYTSSEPINVLARVLKLSEEVCDAYARKTAVSQIDDVTLIMPMHQDVDVMADTIGSLLEQTLLNWKLFIVAHDELENSVKEAILKLDNRINFVGFNDVTVPQGYVKLISPGKKLLPECLELEAVALYNHKEADLTYSNSSQATGINIDVKEFSILSGIDVLNAVKHQSYNLSGGVSGVMIRKWPEELPMSMLINSNAWKEKDILSQLLPARNILVFREKLVQ